MTKNHQKDNEGKITNEQNECTAQIQNRQQNPKHQNRHNHKIGSDVIVIGDSIIKNIQPRKLTKKKVQNTHSQEKPKMKLKMRSTLTALKQYRPMLSYTLEQITYPRNLSQYVPIRLRNLLLKYRISFLIRKLVYLD